MAIRQERNYGIDLLRMVSMFMVTVLHVLGQGGILGRLYPYSAQYLIGWYLEYASYCSVTLFALISGYVGVHSRFRVTNIAMLWLQVFFYSFGIAAIGSLLRPGLYSRTDLIGFAFPVITRKYWYFSAYFSLFLFMPLLNAGANALSKQSLRRVIVAMLLVFSVASSAGKEASFDAFTLVSGYTGLWLMAAYAVGAYVGKYGMWEKVPQPALLGVFFGSAAVSLGLRCLVRAVSETVSGTAYTLKFLSTFISPLVVLGSVALLLFFSRLNCGSAARKWIGFFAPAAFGVYIIHVHPFIWEQLMPDLFAFIAKAHPLIFGGLVLLSAFGIYLVCTLIDLLRVQLFKLLRIKKGLSALENKLLKKKEEIGNR